MYAKLSKEITSEAKIQVDNAFFTDFMPFAPENYVKVYLYGLSLAYLADETVNTIEEIAKRLNIDAAVVSEAFSYWANCGIVNVLSSSRSFPLMTARPSSTETTSPGKPMHRSM